MHLQHKSVEMHSQFPVCVASIEEEIKKQRFAASDWSVEIEAFGRDKWFRRRILSF